MVNMINKGRFINICKTSIKRDGINDLLNWLEKSDFYSAPASAKYHGNYEGGLCEHSLNVFDCFNKLLSVHQELSISEESAAIATLFHDICKVNFYKNSYRNKQDAYGQWQRVESYDIDEKFPCGDHADKSIIILQNFIKLSPDEILAIRAHMGGFDTTVKGGRYLISNIFKQSKFAVLLHLADMDATYITES